MFINTIYGYTLKTRAVSYRPELASLVTYYGRIALYRLFLTIFAYVNTKPNLLPNYRSVLGGDTDSLFIYCSNDELEGIVNMFEKWPSNRQVYKVAIEHVGLNSGIFLGKKNYIFYKQVIIENINFLKNLFSFNASFF